METKLKWILGITVNIVPLMGILLVTKIIIKPVASWWWFFSFLIGFFVINLIVGIILFYRYLNSKKLPEIAVDPQEALKIAIKDKQEELDNPDNIIPEYVRILNVGEPGKPRTSILRIHGNGSELGNEMDGLVDLTKKNGICCWIYNASNEQVIEISKRMAENPELYETENTTISLDEFGHPQKKIESRKIRETQIQQQIENKKEAEELNKI